MLVSTGDVGLALSPVCPWLLEGWQALKSMKVIAVNTRSTSMPRFIGEHLPMGLR